ncbi:MAG: thiamine-phosphate kinase [Pseudanabaena sp.]|jgi:thiamine-monophosphate kinase|uniref:thiamine-phosphate kinase n=1 Tax=Pseudanabaena mucicola TaxID=71190 RepID=UPI002576E805|nr:thiamine-phosphate kinase [Pseudanabaena mucicola]MCA6572967.1 thiamine-phosphate kinase [Pseudanabaena sp. M53BS1SP1A06MG]MCA6581750.1 thiamine-phosphate kinase [Pseudanabaena sp. M34BS1SP1A06MG]MCA6585281.1 thiamine-phosphate kinase [Pseudanabaena sp. M051S1SP1A06QC]MCA6589694.1 thiamine-phosphate kinase [Pseudanabaena sp. M109S1SP1A06QC]MCA6593226.1 thiamine-phosphate kinase [Pseudanabaena sp. M38BS1SP1A06MG]MCA6597363.1 thiamine-phosphate kinase [Pseudanabaena sp. M046S1SP1A06QC]MCA66
MTEKIKDLGEQGLLKIFRQYCSAVVGDDAAPMGGTLAEHQMVVTTDMLVDGVHFSDRTTSPEDVGWRAAAVNLSDLAAMGAKPWGLVMSVGLPSDTTVEWIEGVYRGFSECLRTYGTELVGGDTVRSPMRTLSVTAFGQVRQSQVIHRHTAKVGDAIVVTGLHGLSKAGLEMLLDENLQEKLLAPLKIGNRILAGKELGQAICRYHQRPTPRFDAIALLHKLLKQHNHLKDFPISGMDSSDGLADAIAQICRASQVGAKVFWRSLPIHRAIRILAGDSALDWVLYGGEDFELILCMPFKLAEPFVHQLPNSAIIGEIIEGNQIDGLEMRSAFQHFAN